MQKPNLLLYPSFHQDFAISAEPSQLPASTTQRRLLCTPSGSSPPSIPSGRPVRQPLLLSSLLRTKLAVFEYETSEMVDPSFGPPFPSRSTVVSLLARTFCFPGQIRLCYRHRRDIEQLSQQPQMALQSSLNQRRYFMQLIRYTT